MAEGRIIVLSKAPRPGLAKSRIAAELDDDQLRPHAVGTRVAVRREHLAHADREPGGRVDAQGRQAR